MSNFAQFSGFAGGGGGGAPVGAVADVFGDGVDANGWLIRNYRQLQKSAYPNLFTELGQRPVILPTQVAQAYALTSPPTDLLRGLSGVVDSAGITVAWIDSANNLRGAWSVDGTTFTTITPLAWGVEATLRTNSTQKKILSFNTNGVSSQIQVWSGGSTWSATSMPGSVMNADYNGSMIATLLNTGSSSRLFRISKDNGATWENWGFPSGANAAPGQVWIIGDYVWYGNSTNSSTPAQVYYSNNGTWNTLGIMTLELFRTGDTIWGTTGNATGYYVHTSSPADAVAYNHSSPSSMFYGCQTIDGLVTGYVTQPQSAGSVAGIYQAAPGSSLAKVGIGPSASGAAIGTAGWPSVPYSSGRQIALSNGFYAGQTIRVGLNGNDSNLAATSGGIGANGQAPLIIGALGGAFYAIVPNGVYKISHYNAATQFQIPGQDPVGIETAVPNGYTRMLMGG